jgi:double-stranded uracil-DNA glycosylase
MSLRGLACVGSERPRTLILGSFPSASSLDRGEYYAHDRNHFWPIVGLILGFERDDPYSERLAALAHSGIALWDVIASCEREGSLDKDIREAERNPLDVYIARRPSIERLALNGGKAADSFTAAFAPELGPAGGLAIGDTFPWTPAFAPARSILVSRLPSTSSVPTKRFRAAADKLPYWSAFIA